MHIHAEHACHLKKCGFLPTGRRPIGSLPWHKWELTTQCTFARISKTEVMRYEKATGETEIFGPLPKWALHNGRMRWQNIHAEEYIRARLRHHRHRIFGIPGKEIWHGGRKDFSEKTLLNLWDRITYLTGQVCPTHCPAGRLDFKRHLVLPLAHKLEDEEAQELKGTVLPWREIVPPYTIPLIEDWDRTVDFYRRGFAAVLNPARLAVDLSKRMVEVQPLLLGAI